MKSDTEERLSRVAKLKAQVDELEALIDDADLHVEEARAHVIKQRARLDGIRQEIAELSPKLN